MAAGMGIGILFLFTGLAAPFIVLVTIVISVRALWRSLTLPGPAFTEPACERCRYPVAGLTSVHCPECGTNLHLTGVITPTMEMRRRGGLLPAIAAWTYLMGVVCVAVPALFGGIFMVRSTTTAMTSGPQTWTTPLTPASGAYTSATIATTSLMGMGASAATDITITLALSDGSAHTFQLDPATNSYTTTDPQGATSVPAPYSTTAISTWFAAAALNTADPKIAAEADELETVVKFLQISPFVQPSTMSLKTFTAGPPSYTGGAGQVFSSGPNPDPWLIALAIGALVAFVVWLAGLWFIITRRRRLLAEPAQPRPPAPAAPA